MANDIDPTKRDGYELNFGLKDFLLDDVWKLEPESLPSNVDLLTASFPCTDLSLAGYRQGLAGAESSAFWGVVRLLSGLRDRKRVVPAVMLENVVGFLTSHGGKDFESALDALNQLDYVVDAFVLDAVLFVPQSRPRLFVVAFHRSIMPHPMIVPRTDEILGRWEETLDSQFARVARPHLLREFINRHPALNWALLDAPSLPSVREHHLSDIVEEIPTHDDRWWEEERVEKLLAQMSPLNLSKLDELRSTGKPGYATAYRRMRNGRSMAEVRADGVAGCLRTPKGGSSRQILIVVKGVKTQARLLSSRELARLQGVTDSFKVYDDPVKTAFGFGDAVCVPAITWIGKNVIVPLLKSVKRTDHGQKSI
jgi:DNA (cytosine-5)-methyltransferase 1